jgi:hypothetical protein
MRPISPEDFEIMLDLLDWNSLANVERAQAIAADDPTLTNLYVKYEQLKKTTQVNQQHSDSV